MFFVFGQSLTSWLEFCDWKWIYDMKWEKPIIILIRELENQIEAIFSRNSDPDIVTMYHQLEDRITKTLISLKNSKEETLKWKSMYQELEAKMPAPTKEPGRKRIDDDKRKKVLQMYDNDIPMRKIAKDVGIALGTVSNIVNKYNK